MSATRGASRLKWALRVGLALVLLALLLVPRWHAWRVAPEPAAVWLLQPAAPGGDARAAIGAWRDALAEEGFQALPMDAESLGRDRLSGRPRAMLLPDTALVALSDSAVVAVTNYVRDGGLLLLCFDAGTRRTEDGAYSSLRSRFSQLAGIDYALYSQRGEAMFERDTLVLAGAGAQALGIQPGKAVASAPGIELKTYGYERLEYTHFATQGSVDGDVLARSAGGNALIVRHRMGKGEVLFVNLPLGYLKTRSDGYPLHQSLRLFLGSMAGAPQLLAVPGGVGGMVMNVHVDSGASIAPLQALEERGLLAHGPFSLHFTAGPDTYQSGDRAGLNVDGNPWAQAFIRRMAAQGHEIGNHGGWIHNEFGLEVDETNREQFEPLLARNHVSMTRALGRAPTSYSSPMGNQPLWVGDWLAANGIVAYYDTGGSGLGPTRAWRNGERLRADAWSFPVVNFGAIATLEEIEDETNPRPRDAAALARRIAEHGDTLRALIEHIAAQRISRLTYMHAPAAARRIDVIANLLDRARQLESTGRFRWYRMDDLARHMARREQTEWAWDGRTLRANHRESLAGLTWRLRGIKAEQVLIEQGSARLQDDGEHVLVEALAGSQLQLAVR
jgi:hypothetical protein